MLLIQFCAKFIIPFEALEAREKYLEHGMEWDEQFHFLEFATKIWKI